MLKKYIEISNRFRDTIWKDIDVEVIHDDPHMKTKRKSNKDEIKTNFHNDKLTLEKALWTLRSVILSFYRKSIILKNF